MIVESKRFIHPVTIIDVLFIKSDTISACGRTCDVACCVIYVYFFFKRLVIHVCENNNRATRCFYAKHCLRVDFQPECS